MINALTDARTISVGMLDPSDASGCSNNIVHNHV